jgi:hypothetical protein
MCIARKQKEGENKMVLKINDIDASITKAHLFESIAACNDGQDAEDDFWDSVASQLHKKSVNDYEIDLIKLDALKEKEAEAMDSVNRDRVAELREEIKSTLADIKRRKRLIKALQFFYDTDVMAGFSKVEEGPEMPFT